MEKDLPVLVVGKGLAGNLAAYALLQAGLRVHIMERPMDLSGISGVDPRAKYLPASRAAAGIINPIVLKRLMPTWEAGQFLEYAKKTYTLVQKHSGIVFHTSQAIFKLLPSGESVQFWRKRALDPQNSPWMEPEPIPWSASSILKGIIPQGQRIVPESFFKALTGIMDAKLQDLGTMELWTSDDPLDAQLPERYRAVVLAEGAGISTHPFFKDFNLNYSFGDLVTSSHTPPEHLLHNGLFWLNDGSGASLIGSSFVNAGRQAHSAHEEAQKLVQEVNGWPGVPSGKYLRHRSGVRVKTPDRRPLCGALPGRPGYFVLNGLGSRGYTYAPLLAELLKEQILNRPVSPDWQKIAEATSPKRLQKGLG